MGSAREDGIGCSCLACIRSHRVDFAYDHYHHTLYDVPCEFKNFFEYELREHDMSIGRDLPDPDLPIRAQRRVVNSDNNVLDDGHHFHNSARRDGVHWTYGSKLLKATSVGDPELAKLESLFESLRMIGY